MRQVLCLLFIAHYCASSYAVGQKRTDYIVSELLSSSSPSDESQFNRSRTRPDGGLPNFRHAKPAPIGALAIGQNQPVDYLPHLSDWVIDVQISPLKSLCTIKQILSRAPPALS